MNEKLRINYFGHIKMAVEKYNVISNSECKNSHNRTADSYSSCTCHNARYSSYQSLRVGRGQKSHIVNICFGVKTIKNWIEIDTI